MGIRIPQVNFSKGELADELLGRFDVTAYNAGLRKARNVTILKYGGITKRPGTRFVAEVRDAAEPVSLIPFQYSIEQAYALELGEEYMRPLALGGVVTETAKAVTGLTLTDPVVLTVVGHGWSIGDDIFLTGLGGATWFNGGIFRVTSVPSANTVTFDVDATALDAYTSGGTAARLYAIDSPYAGTDLAEIDHEQSADEVFLAHLDYPPTKLQRHDHTDWEFVTINFGPTVAAPTGTAVVATSPNVDDENDGNAYFPQPASYVVTSINDVTGQESRASTSDSATNDLTLKRNYNTITWVAAADADRYNVFKADNQQDYGYIGTTTSLTFTDDNIGPDLTAAPPVADNPFSGADDYPSTVAFFEQRLMWGRTRNRPNAIWASKSADYENMDFARPLKADDALSFALVAGKVNAVNQLVSIDSLLALTSDSIFKISGANDDYLAATPPPRSRRQIGRGSSRLSPLIVDNVVFYQPNVGNSIRALGYSFDIDSVKSDDISIFSPHFFAGMEIVSWAYAQEPRSVIWAARSDGKLLCFTWEQEQQVWGWTLCETDGFVESVCVISEEGEDRLYMVVRRVIESVDRVYIERMAAAAWEGIDDCCFTDCSVSYEFGTAQTELTNLHHLEGRTLTGVADGNVVPGLIVANGVANLPHPALRATVGLAYEARIETLPLIFQGREGSNVGKKQTTGQVVIRVVRSRGLRVGPSEGTIYAIKPRANEDYGSPIALATGDYEVDMPPVVSSETKMIITSPDPLPMTITGVALEPIVTG